MKNFKFLGQPITQEERPSIYIETQLQQLGFHSLVEFMVLGPGTFATMGDADDINEFVRVIDYQSVEIINSNLRDEMWENYNNFLNGDINAHLIEIFGFVPVIGEEPKGRQAMILNIEKLLREFPYLKTPETIYNIEYTIISRDNDDDIFLKGEVIIKFEDGGKFLVSLDGCYSFMEI